MVFTYLLDEGYQQLSTDNEENLSSKGNDMELFHFLSAGPHVINYAPGILRKNLKDIEDLILNKRFTPLPPRPKAFQLDINREPHIHQPLILNNEYPSKYVFKNNVPGTLSDLNRDSHIYQPSIPKEYPFYENYLTRMLRKNYKDSIKDLNLNKRFTPFPPRLKTFQLDSKSYPYIHKAPFPEEHSFKYSRKSSKHYLFPDLLYQENYSRYLFRK